MVKILDIYYKWQYYGVHSMITYNHDTTQEDQNVLIDYAPLGKSSDVNNVSPLNRAKVTIKDVNYFLFVTKEILKLIWK